MLTTKSLALVGAAAMLFATGCSDTGGETNTGSVVQDFSLTDVNATSATHNQELSPRDFLGQGSAWYFGHST